MKKALLVVSFGTSYVDVIQRCIQPVVQAISDALPAYDLYQAFTSGFIVKKLQKTSDYHVDLPEKALETLISQGYQEILVQPTHLLPGFEYDKLKAKIVDCSSRMPEVRLVMGEPLLASVKDYTLVAEALMASLPLGEAHQRIILMGHGTEHESNAVYTQMQEILDTLSQGRIFMACVEAAPTLEDVMGELKAQQIKEVLLTPFLLVAGDHAQNDMAGDEEDSWINRLSREGIKAEALLKGLGEYPAIRSLYKDKVLRLQKNSAMAYVKHRG